MKISSVGIAVFAIILICSPLNAEELTKAEIAAQDFSYQGIGIGTTLKDFKRRFPNAFLLSSDKSSMTSKYLSGIGAPFMNVSFFRGKIYEITIILTSEKLSEIGGQSVLDKKLIDTFGAPYVSKDNTHGWKFPRVHRYVRYAVLDIGAAFSFCDSDVEEQVTAIKAKKLHLGF